MEDPDAEIESVVPKVTATLTRRSTGNLSVIHESRYGFQTPCLFLSSGTKLEAQSSRSLPASLSITLHLSLFC